MGYQENDRVRAEKPAIPERVVLSCGGTETVVLPQGAYVASFRVDNADVLFPDQMVGEKRRGGAPILFPNAGPLTEKQGFYNLAQHGFGRDMDWEVDTSLAETMGGVALGLRATDETLAQFQHDFDVGLAVSVEEGILRRDLLVRNPSSGALPVAWGAHDYLGIPFTVRPGIRTNIPGFNPDPGAYNWRENPPVFPWQEEVTVAIPTVGLVSMKASSNLRKIVVWDPQIPLREGFPPLGALCFEFWVGPVDALLHKGERVDIPAGGEEHFWIETRFYPEGK